MIDSFLDLSKLVELKLGRVLRVDVFLLGWCCRIVLFPSICYSWLMILFCLSRYSTFLGIFTPFIFIKLLLKLRTYLMVDLHKDTITFSLMRTLQFWIIFLLTTFILFILTKQSLFLWCFVHCSMNSIQDRIFQGAYSARQYINLLDLTQLFMN